MSWTSVDDMARHRDWLDRQIRRPRWHDGSEQNTFVIRLSFGPEDRYMGKYKLANELASERYPARNLTIEEAVGIWEGEVESGLTITWQADRGEVIVLMHDLRDIFPDVEWVHVEEHRPRTWYVNLDQEDERA